MQSDWIKAALTSCAAAIALGGATAAHANSDADNPYSPAHGHSYRHGVVPTIETARAMKKWREHYGTTQAVTGPNTLIYGGGTDGVGVTSGKPKVYLIVYGNNWGTQGTDADGNATFTGDPNGEVPRLQQLFKGLGTANERWSTVFTQYCDGSSVAAGATSCPSGASHIPYPSGGVFAGIWYDDSITLPPAIHLQDYLQNPSPDKLVTAHQLVTEAITAAAHFGNTTAESNRYAQYVILTPTGTDADDWLGFLLSVARPYCAWHSYNEDPMLDGGPVASPYGDIAFINMPYVTDLGGSCGQNLVNSGSAGTLDSVTMVAGHEYAETVTDQFPPGGWINGVLEDGDECEAFQPGAANAQPRNIQFVTGSFAMQSTWSNADNACAFSYSKSPLVNVFEPAITNLLLNH